MKIYDLLCSASKREGLAEIGTVPSYTGPARIGNPNQSAADLNRQSLNLMAQYGAQGFQPNAYRPTVAAQPARPVQRTTVPSRAAPPPPPRKPPVPGVSASRQAPIGAAPRPAIGGVPDRVEDRNLSPQQIQQQRGTPVQSRGLFGTNVPPVPSLAGTGGYASAPDPRIVAANTSNAAEKFGMQPAAPPQPGNDTGVHWSWDRGLYRGGTPVANEINRATATPSPPALQPSAAPKPPPSAPPSGPAPAAIRAQAQQSVAALPPASNTRFYQQNPSLKPPPATAPTSPPALGVNPHAFPTLDQLTRNKTPPAAPSTSGGSVAPSGATASPPTLGVNPRAFPTLDQLTRTKTPPAAAPTPTGGNAVHSGAAASPPTLGVNPRAFPTLDQLTRNSPPTGVPAQSMRGNSQTAPEQPTTQQSSLVSGLPAPGAATEAADWTMTLGDFLVLHEADQG